MLFLYFFYQPHVGWAPLLAVLAAWAASMAADLASTLASGHLIAGHERSLVLSWAHARHPRAAAAVAAAAESACVALLPAAATHAVGPGPSAAVAFAFCVLHCQAILSNDTFVSARGYGGR